MQIHGVAINPIAQKQFTDHLAPLAASLNIPYLFHDREEEKSAKKFYPGLNTILLPFEEFNPEYLIANFDCTFLSDQWEKTTFDAKFLPLEKQYGKKMRNVHCPHGFSDKGFYLRGVAFEDISLIYGQNMLDLLQEWGVLDHLKQFVFCGNYRLQYYQKNKIFYDSLINNEIKTLFAKKQPILLYAPTCEDLEDSSSFFSAGPIILENLPKHLNLIVKPHPRLELDNPARFYEITSRYENQENILFLSDWPLIYPLLSITDVYIGDMSSIGYDFLAFNKPMFFLNQQKRDPKFDRGLFLFGCGVSIEPEQYPLIYEIIEKQHQQDFSDIRKRMYEYTFGKPISIEKIQEELLEALAKNEQF